MWMGGVVILNKVNFAKRTWVFLDEFIILNSWQILIQNHKFLCVEFQEFREVETVFVDN